MQQYCTHIDKQGYIIGGYLFTDKEIADFDGILLIGIEPPSGVGIPIKAKWDGQKWIEGATQSEIDDLATEQLLVSLHPSQQELTDADLEIKMITLLMEMEVI